MNFSLRRCYQNSTGQQLLNPSSSTSSVKITGLEYRLEAGNVLRAAGAPEENVWERREPGRALPEHGR